MSYWTYVTGVIEVHVPGRSQPEIQYIIDSVMEHLPRVTGSEGNMEVTVLKKPGHDSSSSCDEFGMKTNNLIDMEYRFKTRHGWMETQSIYQIVVSGSLRDRHFETTKREFMKWLCRLSKRLGVYNILVRISGDFDRSMILDDDKPLIAMWESPSWCELNWNEEPSVAWWEYLMWERDPQSDMPLLLSRKYIADEENDKEIERREAWQDHFSCGKERKIS